VRLIRRPAPWLAEWSEAATPRPRTRNPGAAIESGMMPNTLGRRRHTLWLGVSPGLTDAHIDYVNATIRNFVQKEDGLQPVMPPVHAVFCGPPRTLACHHQLH
jgi:hypothetical protein